MDGADLSFEQDGAVRHDHAAFHLVPALETVLAACPCELAGVRLHGVAGLSAFLSINEPIGRIAADRLGPAARPVRAILFDKTPGQNWVLGWHQDRTIAVQARRQLPGWGPWSIKGGVQHVEPPFEQIARLMTLRIHLDDVPVDNAPLLVAPGSHLLGRIPEHAIDEVVERCGVAACLAARGDVWAYATQIVHASAASRGHARRRVLQVDYAATDLPTPLKWAGV